MEADTGITATDVVETMRKIGITVTEDDVLTKWDLFRQMARLVNQDLGL